MKFKFEHIDDEIYRAKVLGGWIVKIYEDTHVSLHQDQHPQIGYEWRISTCFVPDPKHEWVIDP